MEIIFKDRSSMARIGTEGALLALSPLPFLLAIPGTTSDPFQSWRFAVAFLATLACITCALTLFRLPRVGKLTGSISAVSGFISALPSIAGNPFAALAGSIILISLLFTLLDFNPISRENPKNDRLERCFQRAWWSLSVVPLVVLCNMILGTYETLPSVYVIAGSSIIAQLLFFHWAIEQKAKVRFFLPIMWILLLGFVIFLPDISLISGIISGVALFLSLLGLVLLPPFSFMPVQKKTDSWAVLLDHPARVLLATFFVLRALGTFLLVLPIASRTGHIDLIDAVFTAVSAVCVTGLIVLDTPHDFTVTGQCFIALLIQLGGLGIMSIATIALYAMGRRLSLRQERLMSSITDTEHSDLFRSLATILKFTFLVEGFGAVLLTMAFYFAGDTPADAIWRGVFTAISAFCNAGFALQTDSLLVYQANPFVIQTVATLIIAGGMAPAICLVIPRWLSGRRIPIPARIALTTSMVLLLSGALVVLAFEWHGVLAGMSLPDKIQNAWFQSVTLRTAGFNSVDIAAVTGPTFLFMLCFMFIGGSPGGTAGGVKTTTIGILAMTFWANVTNRKDVIIQHRRIRSVTIYQAVTIVVSGIIIWFAVVVMLEATQQISVRDLIFEATSAIATVGLSTGATSQLDEIGKIIIIIAMFVGRIGPITLFMLLSDEQATGSSKYLDVKISLT
jgi:trk system potassium uptake protein TrkH